jgi:hypothetical protein
MESQGYLGILHSNPLGVVCQSFFRCIAARTRSCPPAGAGEAPQMPIRPRITLSKDWSPLRDAEYPSLDLGGSTVCLVKWRAGEPG